MREGRALAASTIRSRVAKFNTLERHVPDRHHDAIEFADGNRVLVTQLREGQRMTVLQLPVTGKPAERKTSVAKKSASGERSDRFIAPRTGSLAAASPRRGPARDRAISWTPPAT